MAVETGLTSGQVDTAIERLEADGKIKYKDEWLALRDGLDGLTGSSKVQAAVDTQLAAAPQWVGQFVMRGEEDDDRASHPAIVAAWQISGRYPKKDLWDTIIEIVGDDPDWDLMTEAHDEWSDRGYSPLTFIWITDWVANKRIPYRNNGRTSNTEKLKKYADVFSS
jgi:hypothetical protein